MIHSLRHNLTAKQNIVQSTLLREGGPSAVQAEAQHVQVLVPPGMRPGQQMEFDFKGQKVRITLPASARPGQTVLVGLPSMPPGPTRQLSMDEGHQLSRHH